MNMWVSKRKMKRWLEAIDESENLTEFKKGIRYVLAKYLKQNGC